MEAKQPPYMTLGSTWGGALQTFDWKNGGYGRVRISCKSSISCLEKRSSRGAVRDLKS